MQQIQEKTRKEFADIKHHIGTLQSSQLNEEELSLIYDRLKYQVNALNTQVTNTQQIRTDLSIKVERTHEHSHKPKTRTSSQSKSIMLPKLIKPIQNEKVTSKSQNKKKGIIGKLKQGHMFQAQILDRELRMNPFADLPAINDEELNKGIYNLVISGVIPKDVNVNAAFRRGGDIIQTQQVQLATEKSRFYSAPQENLTRYKLSPPEKSQVTDNYKSRDLSINKKEYQQKKDNPEKSKSKYIIEIKNNHFVIDYYYMMKHLQIWGAISQLLKRLERIASGQLDGDQVALLAQSQFKVTLFDLYGCYITKHIMQRLYVLNKKQFTVDSALIKIQASVKMFIQFRKFQHQKKIVQKVIRIQKEFRLKQQYLYTINEVKKRVGDQISTLESRQQQFKLEDFSQTRIEIHIPSYTLKQFQRLTMSNFVSREGLQLNRLFALKDPRVTIIYVTNTLPEEVLAYYYKLLEIAGINFENRLHLIFPENFNKFPSHYSLSQLLYFSPKAIYQIKQLIEDKFSYIVPMRVGKEEFILSELLKTNILSGPYEITDKLSKKSVSKELFIKLGLPVSPGCSNIADKEDFINKLTALIYKNLQVSKWYFKVDIEFNGRGTAWFSLEGVKQFIELRQNANFEINILRELVQALLPIKTVFPFPQMFTFDEYLEYFLNYGGIIEACPQAQKIQTINLLFNIEPNGGYSMINTSTSLVIKDMTRIGATYPQNQININGDSMIGPVVDELYKQGIFGYGTLSLLCFNGMFLTKSLRFGMDEQFSANFLVQAMHSESFTYIPFLYHPAIADQKYGELFTKCRKEGVSFDVEKKSGTLILLSDSIDKGILSLMCLGSQRKSIKLTTEALNFLMQFGGTLQNNNVHQKKDVFYFIDIVSKLRYLNSESQL